MKDLSERRKTLIAVIEDERISRLREQDARRGAVKEDQANRLREFKTALARKWRPSRALWPTP